MESRKDLEQATNKGQGQILSMLLSSSCQLG